jgi:Ni,Fe-hydrogenase III small subunit
VSAAAFWRALWRNLRRPAAGPAAPRTVALLHANCGSCNGCEIELALLLSAAHQGARHGLALAAEPQHAEALLVTGPVTRATQASLGAAWDRLGDPRAVVAVGDCAVDGGVFKGSYAVAGGAGSTVPVNIAIRGCPPTPKQLLEGLKPLI